MSVFEVVFFSGVAGGMNKLYINKKKKKSKTESTILINRLCFCLWRRVVSLWGSLFRWFLAGMVVIDLDGFYTCDLTSRPGQPCDGSTLGSQKFPGGIVRRPAGLELLQSIPTIQSPSVVVRAFCCFSLVLPFMSCHVLSRCCHAPNVPIHSCVIDSETQTVNIQSWCCAIC